MQAAVLFTAEQAQADAEYKLAPDAALLITEHGSAFAFDMRNSFYAISAIGATMLERILRGSKANAVAVIAAEYDAEPATIEADLERFLNDLEKRGVVLHRDAQAKAHEPSLGANLIARAAKGVLSGLSRTRVRATATLILARLSFALFGWNQTLAAWKQHVSAAADAPEAPEAALREIDDAVRTGSAKLPFGGDCKERALSCWALSRRAGIPAALVVGVVQYPLGGHTWCQSRDGAILGDDAEHCAKFLPVFRYE